MREQHTTGWKLGEDFVFLQIKRLAIYKQRAYILAFEYTDQVGYITMKKGLEFFL